MMDWDRFTVLGPNVFFKSVIKYEVSRRLGRVQLRL